MNRTDTHLTRFTLEFTINRPCAEAEELIQATMGDIEAQFGNAMSVDAFSIARLDKVEYDDSAF